ncbi:DEAD/DEAH box helicase [Roseibacillus persicicus]|uniref:DNA2/NAM7 helicase-like C-terminal domain-containing protein n=1 Tax=Roseibacillus persicicus TaxID=454148 RepID=A0A918TGT8_9BACT|nr:AAA domain-containing protein [Roseibacillus persicicus]GHC46896.1 hypothetical protein GCM10007100_10740 [Roseibacillus persicicus]
MTAPSSSNRFLTTLREDTLREIAASKAALVEIWSLSLAQRVEKGHALGPLRVVSQKGAIVTLAHETSLSQESFSRIREGDLLRMTRNEPLANGPSCFFLHDDGELVVVQMLSDAPLPFDEPLSGLTLDPDFFDPTDRFLAALDALRTTVHGTDVVLPILMGEGDSGSDSETFDEVLDQLEDLPTEEAFHPAQNDAIALSLAASRFHLVQGPPGTGKTHVLAEIACRLIEKGHRVLLTGPTHRAIDHALRSCRKRLPAGVRVVKISRARFDSDSPVEHFDHLGDAELSFDEPFLLGSTTLNLWSNSSGLVDQSFDTVLLDESSQLTLMLATLAMLRAEKFLFFGDHCQLPPVRLAPNPDSTLDDSIFNKLRKSSSTTMLTESWRLNADLAEWPSATFYGNQLTARHDRVLSLAPASSLPALQARPGFVSIQHDDRQSSTRSPEEAERVLELILDLLRGGLAPSDIAVVTPFRAQAALIRRSLRNREEFTPWPVEELLADTVERLQGQEREVILVSMAASRDEFIMRLEDFLFEPRRLNVAITRARRKTILLHSKTLLKVAQSLADSGSAGATTFCSLLES